MHMHVETGDRSDGGGEEIKKWSGGGGAILIRSFIGAGEGGRVQHGWFWGILISGGIEGVWHRPYIQIVLDGGVATFAFESRV